MSNQTINALKLMSGSEDGYKFQRLCRELLNALGTTTLPHSPVAAPRDSGVDGWIVHFEFPGYLCGTPGTGILLCSVSQDPKSKIKDDLSKIMWAPRSLIAVACTTQVIAESEKRSLIEYSDKHHNRDLIVLDGHSIAEMLDQSINTRVIRDRYLSTPPSRSRLPIQRIKPNSIHSRSELLSATSLIDPELFELLVYGKSGSRREIIDLILDNSRRPI